MARPGAGLHGDFADLGELAFLELKDLDLVDAEIGGGDVATGRIERCGVRMRRLLAFVTLASALVASGMPVEQLSSIGILMRPDNLKRALRFLYARAGHRV